MGRVSGKGGYCGSNKRCSARTVNTKGADGNGSNDCNTLWGVIKRMLSNVPVPCYCLATTEWDSVTAVPVVEQCEGTVAEYSSPAVSSGRPSSVIVVVR